MIFSVGTIVFLIVGVMAVCVLFFITHIFILIYSNYVE